MEPLRLICHHDPDRFCFLDLFFPGSFIVEHQEMVSRLKSDEFPGLSGIASDDIEIRILRLARFAYQFDCHRIPRFQKPVVSASQTRFELNINGFMCFNPEEGVLLGNDIPGWMASGKTLTHED